MEGWTIDDVREDFAHIDRFQRKITRLPIWLVARKAGSSKRTLVHYFSGRQNIEEQAITRLENRLRAQFVPEAFPPGATAQAVVSALWDRTTAPQSRGVLLLVMDLSKRAWSGSKRSKVFYQEQQRLWIQLLMPFLPDRATV